MCARAREAQFVIGTAHAVARLAAAADNNDNNNDNEIDSLSRGQIKESSSSPVLCCPFFPLCCRSQFNYKTNSSVTSDGWPFAKCRRRRRLNATDKKADQKERDTDREAA